MRLYSFVNMYLSPIQHGIQTAHIVSELFAKYSKQCDVRCLNSLLGWANDHKTVIVLNAGYSSTIQSLHTTMMEQTNYPNVCFHESGDALCGALTAVGILLPDRIYETASRIRTMSPHDLQPLEDHGVVYNTDDQGNITTTWNFSEWDIKFMKTMNGFKLA